MRVPVEKVKEEIHGHEEEKMIVAMETITKVGVEMMKNHLQVERMNRQKMKR
jgi:hypothetical protein